MDSVVAINAIHETRCDSCGQSKTGRFYDLNAAFARDSQGSSRPVVVTLCYRCRTGFDSADFAIDSEDMFQDFLKRHPEDETVDLFDQQDRYRPGRLNGPRPTFTKER